MGGQGMPQAMPQAQMMGGQQPQMPGRPQQQMQPMAPQGGMQQMPGQPGQMNMGPMDDATKF